MVWRDREELLNSMIFADVRVEDHEERNGKP
jgi:hypothetical protein